MKNVWNRIGTNASKGRISTILGSLTILGCILSVFLSGISWADAAIGMGVGAGLIGLVHK